MKSYEQYCPIARSLSLVGERWSLLIVRELFFGPKRYTDLVDNLPGIGTNILATRLKELESNGLVSKRKLPPPAASTVYALTPWGRELEPVILALARWGSRAMPIPRGDLSTNALVFALETTFDAEAAEGLRARIALVLDGEPFRAEVARRKLSVMRGEGESDATITTDARTLRSVVFGGEELRRVRRDGALEIAGDEALAAQFLALFRRPPPVS